MGRLFAAAAALVLLGCGSAAAQPAPGTIQAPALGTIRIAPGTPAIVAPGAVGAIAICGAAPGFSLDASIALPLSGALATPPLPGATVPPNPSFNPSIASGACNPAIGAQNIVEALGIAAVVAPIPGLATIEASTYADATVPTAMTEAGATGMSPLIVVPSPPVLSSPCGPALTTGTSVATLEAAFGLPSGC
jgi:hypothetical protein